MRNRVDRAVAVKNVVLLEVLARHWPEALELLALGSSTLLRTFGALSSAQATPPIARGSRDPQLPTTDQ